MNHAMTSQPRVSVIIPAYNARGYIARALDSALAQTESRLEIIVVDDGSSDDTAGYVRARFGHDPRLRVITQANAGPSAARNAGARASTGEHLHFLDSDEWWMPEKVARGLALFEAHPDAAVVYGHGIPIDAVTGHEIAQERPPLPSGDVFCAWLTGRMAGGNFGVTSSFMVRRAAFESSGGFDESMRVAEDYDLWIRLAHDYPFAAHDAPQVYYLRRGDGLHSSRVGMARGRLTAYLKARDLPRRRACLDDAAYASLLASRWQTLALALWHDGQRGQARQALRESIPLDGNKAALRRVYALMSYMLPASAAESLMHLRDALKRRAR